MSRIAHDARSRRQWSSGQKHASVGLCLEPLEDRLAPAALVWTDQVDYQAGDTALITASGFAVGETVKFLVVHDKSTPGIPGGEGHDLWRVTDGGAGDLDGVQNGQIQTTWYVSPDDSAGATFHLRAVGLESGLVAKTTFTDGNINTSVSPTSVTVLAGGSSESFSITSTVTGATAGGWKFSINSVYTLSGGVFTGSVPVEYTVAAQGGSGSQSFVTTATVSALAGQATGNFSLILQEAITQTGGTPTLAIAGSATLSVTVGSNQPPTTPTDSDAAINTVAEGVANGALVGITAFATDPNGQTVAYSLTDDAGGRFAIDAATGVVTVADGTLLNYEDATSHNITVQASDGAGGTATQTFTINVANVNPTTPVDSDAAANEVAEAAANGTAVGITASSTDPNGPAVAYSLTDDAGGRFAIDAATGVVTVADSTLLNYEDATSHNITVQASDGAGGTSTQTFTINVANVNPTTPTDSDVAANEVAEGAANGTAVGITASSTDPNGPAVAYSLTDDAGGRFAIDAATGVVTVADGSLLVGPATHSITVQASDGAGGTATQSFTITVAQAPQPENNNPSADDETFDCVDVGEPFLIDVADLLAGDTDPDNDTLSITAVASPSFQGGTVVLNNGTITYTPQAGFSGQDSFTYTLSDGQGGADQGTVFLNLNHLPVAENDDFTTPHNTPVSGNVLADNGNGADNDADNDTLIVTPLVNFVTANGGTVTLDAAGNFTYTSANGFSGIDTFAYTVSDDCDGVVATVSINVQEGEQPPVELLSSLSGFVYIDKDNDGIRDPGESGIAAVTIILSGVTEQGQSVSQITTTTASGFYTFTELQPGTYALREIQPANYLDGKDTLGTPGSQALPDMFIDIHLANGVNGENYNFGEQINKTFFFTR